MTKQTKIASAVASVMTEANMTQKQRGDAWLNLFDVVWKRGEAFGKMLLRECAARNLSVFTIADAKTFKDAHIKAHHEADEKKSLKAAANALAWLRRELRNAGIKVETDKRGGANNKKGANGKTATTTNKPKAEGAGLPQWSQAIALMRDKGVHGLHDAQQRITFVAMLAEVESYFKAMTTAKK